MAPHFPFAATLKQHDNGLHFSTLLHLAFPSHFKEQNNIRNVYYLLASSYSFISKYSLAKKNPFNDL